MAFVYDVKEESCNHDEVYDALYQFHVIQLEKRASV